MSGVLQRMAEDQLEAEELKRLVLREKNLVGNFTQKIGNTTFCGKDGTTHNRSIER